MNETRGPAALLAACAWKTEMVSFLRQLIAIPAPSGKERERCERIKQEYLRLGFDEVFFDGLGSVVARIGTGPLLIMMDGHIDCVGVADAASWRHDPFQGKVEEDKVFGRGAVDELPGVVAAAYGMHLLKQRGWPAGVQVVLVASVLEEELDGVPLAHLIEKEGIRPDVVVLGEPTDMAVFRGHRGRAEFEIVTRGVSAHGAHCDKGVNAIYKLTPILSDLERLNLRLGYDEFLGAGSLTVSYVDCKTASCNAVPDQARIIIDRRLTVGETPESALAEIRALPSVGDAKVFLRKATATSWRGVKIERDAAYPTWVLPENHSLVQGVAAAAQSVLGHRPPISRWMFSTNGVATMGQHGIPTVGFAPGREELAHTTEEWVSIEDLVKAAAVYSLIPEELESAL